MKIKKILIVIILLGFGVLSLGFNPGCAKTVTQLVTYGDEMVVEVTLRGNVDFEANRYFLIVSSNSAYKVPLPAPDYLEDAPELIEPGDTPLLGSQEAYYSNFYNTWSGYVILDPSGFTMVRGPFVVGTTPTREVLSSLEEISPKITFSFRLGRMFAIVPDQIYFDFVTVPWPDGNPKIPTDHLPTSNNYISKISGSIVSIDDGVDVDLEASEDIISCKVEIQ